jgi:hypothetical protein
LDCHFAHIKYRNRAHLKSSHCRGTFVFLLCSTGDLWEIFCTLTVGDVTLLAHYSMSSTESITVIRETTPRAVSSTMVQPMHGRTSSLSLVEDSSMDFTSMPPRTFPSVCVRRDLCDTWQDLLHGYTESSVSVSDELCYVRLPNCMTWSGTSWSLATAVALLRLIPRYGCITGSFSSGRERRWLKFGSGSHHA